MTTNDRTTRSILEQGRAAFAYDCALEGSNSDKRKEYKSYVKKLPMLIKANGLGAAIAFVYAKGAKAGQGDSGKTWGLIYQQLEKWLRTDEKKIIVFDNNQLANQLTRSDSFTYRATTVEILAFLNWLKRFADALIED